MVRAPQSPYPANSPTGDCSQSGRGVTLGTLPTSGRPQFRGPLNSKEFPMRGMWLCLLCLVGPALSQEAKDDDRKGIQGNWKIARGTHNTPWEEVEGKKVVITSDSITVHRLYEG